MIKKPATEIYIDTQYDKLKKDFQKLANSKFLLANEAKDADFLILDNQINGLGSGIQIILSTSNKFIQSSEKVIYFQPFLNLKQGNIQNCATELLEFCTHIAWNIRAPLKHENTILLLC